MGQRTADSDKARDAPRGWTYNPSSWRQRLPIVGLGVVGMGIAFYLASYQLGLVDEVWDPLFGGGTERVLESGVAQLFPVPDALLGSIGYALDWIFGLIGGTDRYRSKPWAVVIFGIGIVPFGGVSIALGLAMPAIVGNGCLLCIVSTVISIVMIPPSWDEIWASIEAMRRMMRRGASLRDAFLGRAAPAAT
ncbi:MAG TPA: vitamin K epoxide reductase family protein [Longimicrobiales bacterium]